MTKADDLADILTDDEVTYFEPYATFTREACVQEAVNFSQSDEFFAVVYNGKVIGKIYLYPIISQISQLCKQKVVNEIC